MRTRAFVIEFESDNVWKEYNPEQIFYNEKDLTIAMNTLNDAVENISKLNTIKFRAKVISESDLRDRLLKNEKAIQHYIKHIVSTDNLVAIISEGTMKMNGGGEDNCG